MEHHKGIFRNIDIVREGRRNRGCINALQEQFGEAADERRAAGKGERVAPANPDKRRDGHDHEYLHQQAQHILCAHKAAVEQCQCRNRHQQDERGADQHPSRIAFIDHAGHLFDCRCLDRAIGDRSCCCDLGHSGTSCRHAVSRFFRSLLRKSGQGGEHSRPRRA